MEALKSALCTACGLCCDGNLFSFVALSSDEAKTFEAAGVQVVTQDGKQRVPQRCGALDGCHCRVYAQRPFVCRKFDCLLVRSLSEKELPLNDALQIVASAKEQLARLDGLLPARTTGEPTGSVRRAAALAQSGQEVSPAARGAFDVVEEFLRRHFVPD